MNLANRITIVRIFLVPVLIASLLYYRPERAWLHPVALGCFVLACLTDALDGYLARRLNEKTVLGAYIDPIADKLLLLSGFLSLSLMEHLPPAMHVPGWLTLFVLSRDVIIVIGSMIIFFASGRLKPEPLFIGKATTVVQMAALFSALVMLPDPWRSAVFVGTAALTLLSGVLYVQMGGRMLQSS